MQSDDKIVVGGSFTQIDGTTSNRIAGLNAEGTPDTTFAINTGTGFSDDVQSVVLKSDGKIVVGGFFSSVNGGARSRVARLAADGTPDTTFTSNTGTGFGGAVYALTPQADGDIVAGGAFTTVKSPRTSGNGRGGSRTPPVLIARSTETVNEALSN